MSAAPSNVIPMRRRSKMRSWASSAIPLESNELVERANGPGTAPTAFRLWQAGENLSDEGSIYFTEKSARLLMAEQAERGRKYPSDYDHLSLKSDRPATSGKASGWHRLEVRPDANGAPELWAVDIEWTAEARAGLEQDPPEWRYFSPAFMAPPPENVVTSYMNFALCINPLTHDLPSLAAAGTDKENKMDKASLLASYATICRADATEDEKKAAHGAIKEHLDALSDGGGVGKTGGEDPAREGEATPEPKKPGADEQAMGDDNPGYSDEDKKKAATAKKNASGGPNDPGNTWPNNKDKPAEGEKTNAAVTALAKHAASQDEEIAKIKRERQADKDAAELELLMVKHPDLSAALKTWCAAQPIAVVRSFLAASPSKTAPRNGSVTQGEGGAVGLQGEDLLKLNAAMGMTPAGQAQFERVPVAEGGGLRIHTMRPTEARALAARAAK